jgi:hypothetical protein
MTKRQRYEYSDRALLIAKALERARQYERAKRWQMVSVELYHFYADTCRLSDFPDDVQRAVRWMRKTVSNG